MADISVVGIGKELAASEEVRKAYLGGWFYIDNCCMQGFVRFIANPFL